MVAMQPGRHGCWKLLLLLLLAPLCVSGNTEGDALNALRKALIDPNNVLQSWDPTLINPCSWFHVTCNNQNNVIRVDLGNAGLSGKLVPQLGALSKLQYLELYSNNISGHIPKELGNLLALVSLDLYQNNFVGRIPKTLGNLNNLQFMRLNNNSLSNSIPVQLTNIQGLQILDLSYNHLSGEVPTNGSFSHFTRASFLGNKKLCGVVVDIQCRGQPPFPSPHPTASPIPSPSYFPIPSPYDGI